METKQKEYNKVYAEYQKIKKCIESCETFEQLRSASGMADRFEAYNEKKFYIFVEILSPVLTNVLLSKMDSIQEEIFPIN